MTDYVVVYEMHAIPVEGLELTRNRIIEAQCETPPALGPIVVVSRKGSEHDFAMCVNGVWKELPGDFRAVHVQQLIRKIERDDGVDDED